MSELVKEAAPSLSPATDLSNQAINKRKLLALSSRGNASGGFDGGQASLVVDAFAEVFASMAIASPPPIENADNVESVPESPQGKSDTIESTDRSNEARPEQTQPSRTDAGETQAQDLGVSEFAVQAEVAKKVEAEIVEQTDVGPSEDSEDSGLTSTAEAEAVLENESTEAAQLAVAATIATKSNDVELGDQALPSTTEENESVDAKSVVAPVDTGKSQAAGQPIDNDRLAQTETAESGELPSNDQAGGSLDRNGDEQPDSGDRRRYSKDDGSASDRLVNATAEKSAGTAKTANGISGNQQPEAVINQSSGASAAPSGDRTAVPPITNAASAAANAAITAVSSAANGTGSATSSASNGATGTSGIARSSATADGSRMVSGSNPSGRPEWASQPKSSNKAEASNNQAETLNRIKLVQRVSRAFQHLGPDGGVVRLRLAPVELGTVRVEMQIQQKKVNARVVAQTDAASSALREHLPELRARLEAHGMQIESLEVETQTGDSNSPALGQRSQKDSGDQNQANGERQTQPDRRERKDHSRTVGAPVSRQPVSLTSMGGVDIRF